jgi:uncharacterized protein YodC (DUF2158 family)
MADEIEIGSIVRLKSGGSNMTVEAIFSDHEGAWVRCSWSDDTKRIPRTFDLDAELAPELAPAVTGCSGRRPEVGAGW